MSDDSGTEFYFENTGHRLPFPLPKTEDDSQIDRHDAEQLTAFLRARIPSSGRHRLVLSSSDETQLSEEAEPDTEIDIWDRVAMFAPQAIDIRNLENQEKIKSELSDVAAKLVSVASDADDGEHSPEVLHMLLLRAQATLFRFLKVVTSSSYVRFAKKIALAATSVNYEQPNSRTLRSLSQQLAEVIRLL